MEKCLLCNDDKDKSEITKLKCNHIFCWVCLETYFEKNLDSKIKCPTSLCHEIFRDDQIRKVLCSEDIEIYESLCLEGLTKAHYCLLTQCKIPIFYQDPDVQFDCANCSLYNCIKCQAPHGVIGCKVYQSKSSKDKVKICEQEIKRAESVLNNKKAIRSREMLLELDTVDLITNDSVFTCDFCCLVICKGEGVKLQNCGDLICKKCLLNSIEKTTEIPAQCPSCQQSVNDREIRTILSDQQFLIYQEKCQDFSKQFIKHFQCQTADCDAFYEISESLKEFICTKCKGKNCIKCKVVHSNETCGQYEARMKKDPNLNAIEEKIKEKKLMRCPKCKNLIMKTRGCDAIQCSNCSTELCWIRQMERWGPGERSYRNLYNYYMDNRITCNKFISQFLKCGCIFLESARPTASDDGHTVEFILKKQDFSTKLILFPPIIQFCIHFLNYLFEIRYVEFISLLVMLIFLVYHVNSKTIQENLLVIRRFGIQHTKIYLIGKIERTFLPFSALLDLHIVEHVDPVKVSCFLAFEQQGCGKIDKILYPVFTSELCLPKYQLVRIYQRIHIILWNVK